MKSRRSALAISAIILVLFGLSVWFTQIQKSTSTDSTSPTYAGIPLPQNSDEITLLKNKGYWVGYSETRKDPVWVIYHLKQIDENTQTEDRPSKFKIDNRTISKISHNDYTNSGYDRGHMAPNYAIASRYGREAQLETFLMSNICPQKLTLNRQIWKNLESIIANKYAQEFEEVWIITGPIFDQNIEQLDSGVEIPDSFYKIIIDEKDNRLRILAFIIPQEVESSESLDKFLTNVDEIEKLTKLDFMSGLEDNVEDKVEAERVEGVW